MKKIFRLIVILPFLLSGCFSFYGIGNKIDLNKLPQEASIDDLNLVVDSKQIYPKFGCKVVDIAWYTKDAFDPNGIFGNIYGLSSALTLTIIPYYNRETFGFNAKLVDVVSNKALKEYRIEEIQHELMWIGTSFFFGSLRNYAKFPSPPENLVKEKIYKAFIRQVTNDAHQFPECKKDQTLPPKRK